MCPFCDNPEIIARAIIREDLVWAFPTNIPIVPGHTLIAPVRHAEKWRDMTASEQSATLGLLSKIQNALKKSFGAEGFNIAWNEGDLARQSVPHFHLHVLPRRAGDTGIVEYEPRKFIYRPGSREVSPEKELRDVSALIQKAL
jgi:diadenosine tetraphosphate (Ap4A) HIT family hydrolase